MREIPENNRQQASRKDEYESCDRKNNPELLPNDGAFGSSDRVGEAVWNPFRLVRSIERLLPDTRNRAHYYEPSHRSFGKKGH